MRTITAFAGLVVLLAVLGMSLALQPIASAEEEDKQREGVQQSGNVALVSPRVEGIVYHVGELAGKTVVTVLYRDINDSVNIYITDPSLVRMVRDGTICTNRFIVAEGVRTTARTLDAQSIKVDYSRPCGTPPK